MGRVGSFFKSARVVSSLQPKKNSSDENLCKDFLVIKLATPSVSFEYVNYHILSLFPVVQDTKKESLQNDIFIVSIFILSSYILSKCHFQI